MTTMTKRMGCIPVQVKYINNGGMSTWEEIKYVSIDGNDTYRWHDTRGSVRDELNAWLVDFDGPKTYYTQYATVEAGECGGTRITKRQKRRNPAQTDLDIGDTEELDKFLAGFIDGGS